MAFLSEHRAVASPPRTLVAVVALLCAGCVVVAAGAGAGGAVYFSGQGVESILTTSIDNSQAAAEQAFSQFGLSRTEFKEQEDGARRELKGRTSDEETEVTVSLRAEEGGSTRLQVTARKSLVTWDKDFAREVAEKIVELAGDS
jgi:hypothetical protein